MDAAAVVYVHGLWMMGAEALPLLQRLRRDRGYRLHVFRYGSMRAPMAGIVDALDAQIARIDAPQVHLLGHSLGGLVILHCLQRHPMAQPGRVVFLGAPVLGSHSARLLAGWRAGRCLLGRAASAELLQPQRAALGSAARAGYHRRHVAVRVRAAAAEVRRRQRRHGRRLRDASARRGRLHDSAGLAYGAAVVGRGSA